MLANTFLLDSLTDALMTFIMTCCIHHDQYLSYAKVIGGYGYEIYLRVISHAAAYDGIADQVSAVEQ